MEEKSKKIREWVVEEKSKRTAWERASRTFLVIETPLCALMCILTLFTAIPGLLATAFLVVVGLTVLLVSYDVYSAKYRKMFSEKLEKEEEENKKRNGNDKKAELE